MSGRCAGGLRIAARDGTFLCKFRIIPCRRTEPPVASSVAAYADAIRLRFPKINAGQISCFESEAAQGCELLIIQPGCLPARDRTRYDGFKIWLSQRSRFGSLLHG